VSSNPAHGEVYSIQHYVIKFVTNLRQIRDFLRVSLVSYCRDITELLLKVALKTINHKDVSCQFITVSHLLFFSLVFLLAFNIYFTNALLYPYRVDGIKQTYKHGYTNVYTYTNMNIRTNQSYINTNIIIIQLY
jgi:hypothetical protein